MMDVNVLDRAAATRAQYELDRLTEIGRARELTPAESYLLERSICGLDGKRYPRGLTRALARHGIKRDMSRYLSRPSCAGGLEERP
ncbi:MAG: hypothetical protein QOH47_851 [Sphingomonadales bacterium]|jgi:hypothetical protein|nr:hypothetical protein [Sphingomonadales bacterium]